MSLGDLLTSRAENAALRLCYVVQLLSRVILCDPMDCSLPGSAVHGISRQEYCGGLPFPPPGDLPDLEIKPVSPAWQADPFPLRHLGSLMELGTSVFECSLSLPARNHNDAPLLGHLSPHSPHLVPPSCFILHSVSAPVPNLWGGGSETHSLVPSLRCLANKPLLCHKPRGSCVDCCTSGNGLFAIRQHMFCSRHSAGCWVMGIGDLTMASERSKRDWHHEGQDGGPTGRSECVRAPRSRVCAHPLASTGPHCPRWGTALSRGLQGPCVSLTQREDGRRGL